MVLLASTSDTDFVIMQHCCKYFSGEFFRVWTVLKKWFKVEIKRGSEFTKLFKIVLCFKDGGNSSHKFLCYYFEDMRWNAHKFSFLCGEIRKVTWWVMWKADQAEHDVLRLAGRLRVIHFQNFIAFPSKTNWVWFILFENDEVFIRVLLESLLRPPLNSCPFVGLISKVFYPSELSNLFLAAVSSFLCTWAMHSYWKDDFQGILQFSLLCSSNEGTGNGRSAFLSAFRHVYAILQNIQIQRISDECSNEIIY